MKPYLAKTRADALFEELENDIVSGKYHPGDALKEMDLVKERNISRTPVREAIHRLEQEHLVEMTEHGMVVRGVLKEDLKDIMLIRGRIEGLAARFAAEAADGEGLARLKEIVDEQEKAVAQCDGDGLKLCDDAFHRQICAMSGHPLLADTLIPLHRKIARYRRLSVASADRAEKAAAEHRAIYEAIARGDAGESQRLTDEHLRRAAESILGMEDEKDV